MSRFSWKYNAGSQVTFVSLDSIKDRCCWFRRTLLEKILLAILTLILCLCLIFLIIFLVDVRPKLDRQGHGGSASGIQSYSELIATAQVLSGFPKSISYLSIFDTVQQDLAGKLALNKSVILDFAVKDERTLSFVVVNNSLLCGGCSPSYFADVSTRLSTLFPLTVTLGDGLSTTLEAPTFRLVNNSDSYCLTSECLLTAASIRQNIDENANPCDDFYQFACGGWVDRNPIPVDQSRLSQFNLLRDDVTRRMGTLYESNTLDSLSAVKQAKNFYRSCNDLELIDELGTTDFINSVVPELGGWPTIDRNWNSSQFTLTEVNKKWNKYESEALYVISVSIDDKNSSIYSIVIDQRKPILGSRDYYLNTANHVYNATLEAYLTYGETVAVLLGAEKKTARTDIQNVLKFETSLAEALTPQDQRRNAEKLYNPMTIDEFSKKYPELGAGPIILENFNSSGVPVNNQTEIINYDPSYFEKLNTILSEKLSTKDGKRILANYIFWRGFVMNFPGALPKLIRDARFQFTKVYQGVMAEAPRYKACATLITSRVPMVGGRLFVDKYFKANDKKTALNMIGKLQEAFEVLLQVNTWMDPETKPIALTKAAAMRKKIAFPDWISDDKKLEDFYKEHNYNSSTYLRNKLETSRLNQIRRMKLLHQPVDKTDWLMAPQTVNAYYNPPNNEIVFPAAILQPPFFSAGRPKSANFGGIGTVIGHEITHGFDDEGRRYDKDGLLREWWSNSTVEEFVKAAQCIVNQYGNYSVPGAGLVNGVLTQGENIADNGGLKQAYKAYRSWVREQGTEEPSLPGLEFTHDKVFFLTAAQVWCSSLRTEAAIRQIKTDPHSPGQFRVIGPASNSLEFARAFNCPLNSKMNPSDKCSLW